MAFLSIKEYTGDGVLTDFTFDFPRLEDAHVKGFVDTTEQSGSMLDATTFRFDVAPANLANITVQRITPIDAPYHLYTDPIYLKDSQLNDNQLQVIYAVEENIDAVQNLPMVGMPTTAALTTLEDTEGNWASGNLESLAAETFTAIGSNSARLTIAEGDISTAEGDIITLDSDLGLAETNITNLQAATQQATGVTPGIMRMGEPIDFTSGIDPQVAATPEDIDNNFVNKETLTQQKMKANLVFEEKNPVIANTTGTRAITWTTGDLLTTLARVGMDTAHALVMESKGTGGVERGRLSINNDNTITMTQAAMDNDGSIVYRKHLTDNYPTSDPTGVTGADMIVNMMSLTQAEYDAITPVATTLYVIT